MPKRKQEWHGRCEFPLTEAYERGHAATFGVKADRHCDRCGRLPAFCECAHPFYGYTCRKCHCPARPEFLVAVDGEHEHRGECPTFVAVSIPNSGPGVGRVGVGSDGKVERLP